MSAECSIEKHFRDLEDEVIQEELRKLAEIGRQGGNALIKKYGVERMRELGRKGGTATKKKLGLEYYRELGRRTHAAISPEALAERSSKGGEATKLRYGKEHYQRMAAKSVASRKKRRAEEVERLVSLGMVVFRRVLEQYEPVVIKSEETVPYET